MGDTATAAGHASRAVASEAVDLVLDYLVPIGSAVAGLMIGAGIFGGKTIADQIVSLGGSAANLTSATANRVAGAIMGLILGVVGYAFWRLGKRDDWIMKLAGKGFGGFFLGTAARYALDNALMGKALGSGVIESFAGGIQQVASGG